MRETVLILNAGDVLFHAQQLRDMPDSALEDVAPSVLRRSANLLRAASYSALTVARRFDARAAKLEAGR